MEGIKDGSFFFGVFFVLNLLVNLFTDLSSRCLVVTGGDSLK